MRGLCQMLPDFAANDLNNGPCGDAELSCEFRVTHLPGPVFLTNLPDLLGSEDCKATALASGLSALGIPVGNIVGGRSEEKVCRVAARRVVAAV